MLNYLDASRIIITYKQAGQTKARGVLPARYKIQYIFECRDCSKELSPILKSHTTRTKVTGRCSSCRAKYTATHHHYTNPNGNTKDDRYNVYSQARQRCTNSKHHAYKNYGGRGIKFLFTSFVQFIEHVGPRPKGYTLDRINSDGHYTLGNVRWADSTTQNRNKRTTWTWRKNVYEKYLQSDQWKTLKAVIKIERKANCENCGSVENLHLHHKHYRSLGHEAADDVMLVCLLCHDKLHRHTRFRSSKKRSIAYSLIAPI